MNREKAREKENGAIIIEASIALPVFMFLMITLYSIIQIAYVQSRMTIAVDCAAKEMAEYAHVYFATGLNQKSADGQSSKFANEVADFLKEIGGAAGSINSELGGYITNAGNAMAGDNITDYIVNATGQGTGLKLLEKNMVSGPDDTAAAFKKRNRIKGVNMMGSKFLEDGGKDVFMQVNYQIQVIKLLNIDVTFDMSSCAYTEAWGGEKNGGA